MADTGTWLKTLNGADVYTNDYEWYWDHATQGWFYAPGLLTAVPAPPIGTRIQDEYTRLTTDWPKLRGAFRLRNGVRGLDWVCGIACRGYLLWFVIWVATRIPDLCNGWWYGTRSLFHANGYFTGDRPMTDAEGGAWVLSVLFFVIALCCVYILYMVYVTTIDSHKGALMLGAIVAGSAYYRWRSNQNNRHNQIIQAIRDGNRQ